MQLATWSIVSPGRFKVQMQCGCGGIIEVPLFRVVGGWAGTECGHIEDESFLELSRKVKSTFKDYYQAHKAEFNPETLPKSRPLMQCGCVANAVDSATRQFVCAVHHGWEKATKIAETPNLDGRKAICVYCKTIEPSNLKLPFFTYRPNHPSGMDDFYCGCRGWN